MDTDLEGKRGFIRLNARMCPELSIDGEFSHSLPALRGLPEHSRLRVSSRAGRQQYDTEALIQMGGCAASLTGAVMSQSGLQGSVEYHSNCTLIQVQEPLTALFYHTRLLIQSCIISLHHPLCLQAWGGPHRVHASGLVAVNLTGAESQVSMVIDDAELKALLALKKTKVCNNILYLVRLKSMSHFFKCNKFHISVVFLVT